MLICMESSKGVREARRDTCQENERVQYQFICASKVYGSLLHESYVDLFGYGNDMHTFFSFAGGSNRLSVTETPKRFSYPTFLFL